MRRRTFVKSLGTFALGAQAVLPAHTSPVTEPDRAFRARTMLRIGTPVLEHLASGALHREMPVEHHPESRDRRAYSRLEAFGRTMTGLAPWLALPADSGPQDECDARARLLALWPAALAHAVDPASPDYMNWSEGAQPLVDAAFVPTFRSGPATDWTSARIRKGPDAPADHALDL